MRKFKDVNELVNELKPDYPVYCIRPDSIKKSTKFFWRLSLAVFCKVAGISSLNNSKKNSDILFLALYPYLTNTFGQISNSSNKLCSLRYANRTSSI